MFTLRGRRPLVVGALIALALTGAAYAYWTAGGSGTGTAQAGDVVALTANQTSTLTAMYPGDSAQTITGNFDNPNSGSVYVSNVVVSIASVAKAPGAVAGTCDASDFTLADRTMAVGEQVPSGTGVGAFSGATIKFNNKANANQDACKNATVNLAYAVN